MIASFVFRTGLIVTCLMLVVPGPPLAAAIEVDLSGYQATSGVNVERHGDRLRALWPIAEGEKGSVTLDLRDDQPLIEELAIIHGAAGASTSLLKNVQPVLLLTVGERDLSKKDGWVIFFDNPFKRPYKTYAAELKKRAVRVTSDHQRTTIIVDEISAGPFRGDLRLTFYPGGGLVRIEAVVHTDQDARAIVYDLGLESRIPTWNAIAFTDNGDKFQRVHVDAQQAAEQVAVRNRVLVAESTTGSVAFFPPPHQFLYPLDFADNFKLVWHGRAWRGLIDGVGFGICQPLEGDKRFVPWINAPPNTDQHLGAFCLLNRGRAEETLAKVRQYTRDDRFKKLDDHVTFTSHYHVEHTIDFLAQQKKQNTDGTPSGLEKPSFVDSFRRHGVDIVHLAEFHVGRSPEFYANRLPSLKAMHQECERLSDDSFLLVPGEEPNAHLGGHWISLFPKPVYWTFRRGAEEPFVEQVDGYGSVYHVGSAADVLRLMEKERGLMWTAHARIKSSLSFPDEYRFQDFYTSDRFLGAAWKAMPADLSQPRLGRRVLDLFDDMANWGQQKYVIGEVDVFQVKPPHELYGHMNMNYVRLKKIPRYRDGWPELLAALRAGQFFVTTGEVLIPTFSIGGKQSGETLSRLDDKPVELEANLEWTFPLSFAEVISGDGIHVTRQRVNLNDTPAFGQRQLHLPLKLTGQKWVRLEVWDVAANGAFTQPIWLK